MKDHSTVYADIIKVDTRPEEPDFRYVHARISDETKDLDGQTADYDWLKSALPDWFKWGNVRDMHENNVVGKAKELTDLGPQVRGFDGVLKVVDPVAVLKLDEELFTGVSIGIKGPRVINNKGAVVHPSQPGTIKGGKIVEVSLVDHPCNENCKITVAKVAGKKLVVVEGAELELLERSEGISPAELETYKKRFHPALGNAGVALSDGSYVIMKPEDLFLAKALRLTGFGNVVAADFLIERREAELTGKAAPAAKQPTADHPTKPNAPGARINRDNPQKNEPPTAKNPSSKNPDKETPATQSPDASGSAAAFDDNDGASSHEDTHPPTKPKKKDGTKKPKAIAGPENSRVTEAPSHTHGDDTGSTGTRTNTAKYANGNPAEWSDKKLAKALKVFKKSDPESYKTATSSYSGDGRPLLEQIARSMQGRIYSAVDLAQGSTTVDTAVDKPEEAGETSGNELLNQSGLMRDGDPRINAHSPADALAQGGPMNNGNSTVTAGGDAGVPNTAHPFDTAPQAGSSPARMAPGSLPGTLSAPGDADPRQNTSGPSGSGGMSPASPPLRPAGVAAQAGPDPNAGGGRTVTSTTSAFITPQRAVAAPGKKVAKPNKKKGKNKKAKMIDKLAKAAVADRIEAALPDSTKAAIAGLLKKFTKDLERDVLSKYATADQLESIQADIEKLGSMAKPGGPFVGPLTAVEKTVNANEFAQPETQVIGPDILEQIERYERMTKSDNRQLAISAAAELKKLLDSYFPQEVQAELQKRKRSAAK